MTKPDITLEPSKGVVSQMAAQIYAAYITRGVVKNGEEVNWMQRSIREAVRIARTIDASIESDEEPDSSQEPSAGPSQAAPSPSAAAAPTPPESPAAANANQALGNVDFDEVTGEASSEGSP